MMSCSYVSMFPEDAGPSAYLVEVVELFWGDKSAHELPPLQVLARTNTHCGDVELAGAWSWDLIAGLKRERRTRACPQPPAISASRSPRI